MRYFLLFLSILLLSTNAHAEDMSIYETMVDVNATAENSATAREKALTEANRKALYAVTNRISSADSTTILDQLNDNQILNFIQEVSVLSEKVSETQYLASLKVTVNARILKAYLADKNAPVTILPETHVFIIPVLSKSETATPLLWEDENDWYTAWQENDMESGQITIVPLAKNSQNREVLHAQDALQLNAFSLEAAKPINAIIFVAHAIIKDNTLQTDLLSPQTGISTHKSYVSIDYEQAIQDIKSSIMKQIQQQTLSQQTNLSALTAVFNFSKLSDWMEIQKDLQQIQNIKKFEVETLASGRAQFKLEYTDSLENLQHTLSIKNLILTDSGNFYTLERM